MTSPSVCKAMQGQQERQGNKKASGKDKRKSDTNVKGCKGKDKINTRTKGTRDARPKGFFKPRTKGRSDAKAKRMSDARAKGKSDSMAK